jgi:hypothetical protein
MRISELIAKLQEAMAEHGDIHVAVDVGQTYSVNPELGQVEGLVRDLWQPGWHVPTDAVRAPADASRAEPHLIVCCDLPW